MELVRLAFIDLSDGHRSGPTILEVLRAYAVDAGHVEEPVVLRADAEVVVSSSPGLGWMPTAARYFSAEIDSESSGPLAASARWRLTDGIAGHLVVVPGPMGDIDAEFRRFIAGLGERGVRDEVAGSRIDQLTHDIQTLLVARVGELEAALAAAMGDRDVARTEIARLEGLVAELEAQPQSPRQRRIHAGLIVPAVATILASGLLAAGSVGSAMVMRPDPPPAVEVPTIQQVADDAADLIEICQDLDPQKP